MSSAERPSRERLFALLTLHYSEALLENAQGTEPATASSREQEEELSRRGIISSSIVGVLPWLGLVELRYTFTGEDVSQVVRTTLEIRDGVLVVQRETWEGALSSSVTDAEATAPTSRETVKGEERFRFAHRIFDTVAFCIKPPDDLPPSPPVQL